MMKLLKNTLLSLVAAFFSITTCVFNVYTQQTLNFSLSGQRSKPSTSAFLDNARTQAAFMQQLGPIDSNYYMKHQQALWLSRKKIIQIDPDKEATGVLGLENPIYERAILLSNMGIKKHFRAISAELSKKYNIPQQSIMLEDIQYALVAKNGIEGELTQDAKNRIFKKTIPTPTEPIKTAPTQVPTATSATHSTTTPTNTHQSDAELSEDFFATPEDTLAMQAFTSELRERIERIRQTDPALYTSMISDQSPQTTPSSTTNHTDPKSSIDKPATTFTQRFVSHAKQELTSTATQAVGEFITQAFCSHTPQPIAVVPTVTSELPQMHRDRDLYTQHYRQSLETHRTQALDVATERPTQKRHREPVDFAQCADYGTARATETDMARQQALAYTQANPEITLNFPVTLSQSAQQNNPHAALFVNSSGNPYQQQLHNELCGIITATDAVVTKNSYHPSMMSLGATIYDVSALAHQTADHDIATDLTNSCSYLFKALQGAEKAYTVFQRGVTRGVCNNFEHRYNVVTGLLTQPIVTLHQEYVEPLMIAGNFLGKAVSKSFDLLRASSSPQEFETKARPLVAMAKNVARGIYNNPEDALALLVDIVLPSPTSFLRRCATLTKTGKFSHSVQEVKQITQKISTETTITRDLAKTADPLATVADEAIKVAHAEQKMVHQAEKAIQTTLQQSVPGRKTSNLVDQFEKAGGFNEALVDFEKMGLTGLRDIPNGKVGYLPDGRTVNVRLKSKEGRPTLEIYDGKKSIKIRYG